MTFTDRLRAAIRAFVLGSAVVEPADMAWGHDPSEFAPAALGDYIGTSNGVYSCATLRASLLSSVPLRVYRVRGNGDKQTVTSGPLVSLLSKINPYWTFQRLIEMTELSLCLWGSAYWFLERGQSGKMTPSEIWWGRPDRVRVVPHPRDYVSGFLYDSPHGGQLAFAPSEVIWLRYPNPVDEYAGLSPLMASQVSVDYATTAMTSNRNLFRNGIQMGGAIFPKSGYEFTPEQARDIETTLARRFQGIDRAHRWAVFRAELAMQPLGMSPRDAEFVSGLRLALEDIARAYRVPMDLIGGQRTYENVNAAMTAIWTNCIRPETRFISSELTEQLLPMFGSAADLVEFDLSQVEPLQEAQGAVWQREREQIEVGVLTRNEWRASHGEATLPWGDAWWAPAGLTPVVAPAASSAAQSPRQAESAHQRMDYGGAAHLARFARFAAVSDPLETRFATEVNGLFARQRASILAHVGRGTRQLDPANPFDLARWVREFRQAVRVILRDVVAAGGQMGLDDLLPSVDIPLNFNLSAPAVIQFLEERAQRFATQVNETTWQALKASLAEGIQAGETIEELAQRVDSVMTQRRSTTETIARTEVIGALNGGSLEMWRQSGVVAKKQWLAALDDRLRDTHRAAHGQAVGIDQNFAVGDGHGPHPGAIGIAAEDINCRCSMVPILDTEI